MHLDIILSSLNFGRKIEIFGFFGRKTLEKSPLVHLSSAKKVQKCILTLERPVFYYPHGIGTALHVMRRMRKFCFFVIEVNSESELCVFFGTLIQTTSLDQISFCAQKEKQQHVIYLPWTPFVLFSDQTSSKADATSKVSATFCKKLQVNSFFTPTRLQFYFLPKSHLFLNYFC